MKYFFPLAFVLLLGAGCVVDAPTDTANDDGTQDISADDVGADDGSLGDDMIGDGDDVGQFDDTTTDDDGTAADEAQAVTLSMKSGNFFFDPDTITAKAGQEVKITFSENMGFHTFVIDEIDFKQQVEADGTVTFKAPATPGSYEFYCDVGSHRQLGMKGTLVVE